MGREARTAAWPQPEPDPITDPCLVRRGLEEPLIGPGLGSAAPAGDQGVAHAGRWGQEGGPWAPAQLAGYDPGSTAPWGRLYCPGPLPPCPQSGDAGLTRRALWGLGRHPEPAAPHGR